MKRLVIAVDCDDVLVRTTPYFIEAYNRIYGTSVTLAQAHDDTDVSWGADRATLEARLAQLMDTDEYRLLAPTSEEVATLRMLADHHELHVITARRPEERTVTQRMIDTYLPGIFTSLELVGFTGSKGEVCARIKANVLIDDNARHLDDAIKKGIPHEGALLFGGYPWNTEVDAPIDVIRCDTWSDVQREIEQLAR